MFKMFRNGLRTVKKIKNKVSKQNTKIQALKKQ